jgi:hypothetical protein
MMVWLILIISKFSGFALDIYGASPWKKHDLLIMHKVDFVGLTQNNSN